MGDDNTLTDDEDGLEQGNFVLIPGESFRLFLRQGDVAGVLNAWIDYNRDGDWDDSGEQIATNLTVGGDGFVQTIDITVPRDAVQGESFGRFRISTQADLLPTGEAPDGEVEDHMFLISGLDFGDAPDSYGTTFDSDGARHATVRNGETGFEPFTLGSIVDAEFDGTPGVLANSDDTTGVNDADGVSGLDASLVPGTSHPITVNVTVPEDVREAEFGAWVDFNRDGDFRDSSELVLDEYLDPSATGPIGFEIPVPSDAVLGQTYARFRLTSESGINFDGLAKDGEVEDYLVTIGAIDCSLDVTTTTDGGSGSLRDAIICANAMPGPNTISLPAGMYSLDLVGGGEEAAAFGDLDITDELINRGRRCREHVHQRQRTRSRWGRCRIRRPCLPCARGRIQSQQRNDSRRQRPRRWWRAAQ